MKNEDEFLTTRELSRRIKLAESTIYNKKCKKEFIENIHYVKAGTKLLFIWPAIQSWLRGEDSPGMESNSETEKPEDNAESSTKAPSYKPKSKPESKIKI